MNCTVSGAEPETLLTLKEATGATTGEVGFSPTEMVADAIVLSPADLVAMSVTVYVPMSLKVWTGEVSVEVVPSPNDHA